MSAAVAVRERPLLMSGEMVRATLEDRKTKTRRVVTRATSEVGTGLPWNALDWSRAQVDPGFGAGQYLHVGGPDDTMHRVRCRYAVGGPVWVRESHTLLADWLGLTPGVNYAADDTTRWNVPMRDGLTVYNADKRDAWKRRPSIFMLREHSRLTLEITDVRVERVQDISEEDARAEGVEPDVSDLVGYTPYKSGFAHLWQQLNWKRGYSWGVNPFCWVLEFRRVGN